MSRSDNILSAGIADIKCADGRSSCGADHQQREHRVLQNVSGVIQWAHHNPHRVCTAQQRQLHVQCAAAGQYAQRHLLELHPAHKYVYFYVHYFGMWCKSGRHLPVQISPLPHCSSKLHFSVERNRLQPLACRAAWQQWQCAHACLADRFSYTPLLSDLDSSLRHADLLPVMRSTL